MIWSNAAIIGFGLGSCAVSFIAGGLGALLLREHFDREAEKATYGSLKREIDAHHKRLVSLEMQPCAWAESLPPVRNDNLDRAERAAIADRNFS